LSRDKENPKPSLRANGSRECAPDGRLHEAIQLCRAKKEWIASSLALLAMTSFTFFELAFLQTHFRILAARCARGSPRNSRRFAKAVQRLAAHDAVSGKSDIDEMQKCRGRGLLPAR